jgi:hypothetical protein
VIEIIKIILLCSGSDGLLNTYKIFRLFFLTGKESLGFSFEGLLSKQVSFV